MAPGVPAFLGRVLGGDGRPAGTCFQVAPGVLVTAWHVLGAGAGAAVGATVRVDDLAGHLPPAPATVVRVDPVHDLAVLRADRPLADRVPGLSGTDAVPPGAAVTVAGVAVLDGDTGYRHAPATGVWVGTVLREDGVGWGRADCKQLARGMSGAPVRTADGRVVGVVSGRYNSVDGWSRDTVWAARVEDLEPLLAGLVRVPAGSPPGWSGPRGPLDEAAERLAEAVVKRCRDEETSQRIWDPVPLPVRWRRAPADLTDRWENISRAPAGASFGPLPLDGALDEITEVYRTIPSRRLVILGRAGSGKTILALRFCRILVDERGSRDPVPVMFSIGSWNPATTTLDAWLTDQLERDFPGLAVNGASGSTLAGELIGADWILPVLDGFDEIARGLHRRALEALSGTALPLLLTGRPDEYRAAVAETRALTAAAGVELVDLSPAVVADYLRRTAPGPVWNPVLAELRDHPDSRASANLAPVLATPLMVALARTVYGDTPDRDPAELLDTDRFATRRDVEDHLVANFVPTVYRHRPDRRDWDLGRVHGWLGYLAEHLDHLRTGNLAWWQLGATLRGSSRTLLVDVVTGLVFGLVNGVATGLDNGLTLGPVAGLKIGLLSGTVLGVVAAIMFGLLRRFVSAEALRRPSRVEIRGRGGWVRRFGSRFVTGLGVGVAGALGVWFVVGLVVWFLANYASWLVRGSLSGLVAGLVAGHPTGAGGLPGVLANVLRFGLVVGVMCGLVLGLALGIMTALEAPIEISAETGPIGLLAKNRTTVVVQVLVWASVGVVLCGVIGAFWLTVRDGLVLGATIGVGGGLGFALSQTSWGQWFVLARLWLPLTGRLPWRPVTFLRDAHRRNVLRQAGVVYQFRHARLREHLTRAHPSRPPVRPRPTSDP